MSFARVFVLAVGVCLAASSGHAASIVLHWTAPGDDGRIGRATQYDLRYATFAITTANWNQATRVTGLARPLPYGNREVFTVSGLQTSTTYYFAIKTADEQSNWSLLSNTARLTTCAGCTGITGNVNNSADGRVDLADLATLVGYLTANSGMQICFEEANIDASLDGLITLTDLSLLTQFLVGTAVLPQCR